MHLNLGSKGGIHVYEKADGSTYSIKSGMHKK
jgi:hypothetical protein